MPTRAAFDMLARLTTFGRDERGAIAVLFALFAVPVLGLALTSIDYIRAQRLEGRLQAAMDSAASAAVTKLGMGRDEVETTARRHLDEGLPEDMKGAEFTIEINPKQTALRLEMETRIQTSVLGLLGVASFPVRVASTAQAQRLAPAKIARQVEEAVPDHVRRDVERALERLGGSGGGGAATTLTREQQEELQRAAEDANRRIQDVLGRISR